MKQEHYRITAFMQEYNVPGLFRSLAVMASSRKMASRTGIADLVAALDKLNLGLLGVTAGIPEAAHLIEPLRSAASSRRLPTGGTATGSSPGSPDTPRPSGETEKSPPKVLRLPLDGGAVEASSSRSSLAENEQLRTPRIPPAPRPREHSPLKPMPPSRDQAQDGREEGPIMGRTLHLPNIHRLGVGISADPGDKAIRQLQELGEVVAFIDDYQRDLRQSVDESMEPKSTPPLLKPGEPSPRARNHRLVLSADGPHRGPTDYHVHASEHPPPSIFEQVTVDVFQPIPEVQEEQSNTEIWASKS